MNFLLGLFFFCIAFAPFALVIFIVYQMVKNRQSNTPRSQTVFHSKFLWILGILLLSYNLFQYSASMVEHAFAFRIGHGLFFATVICALLFLSEKRRNAGIWLIAVTGIVASVLTVWRASVFVQIVNTITIITSTILLYLISSSESINWQGWWLFRRLGRFIVESIENIIRIVSNSTNVTQNSRFSIPRILLTAGITLVVVSVFIVLLSEADPVFDALMLRIREELLGRTVLSLLLACVLTATLSLHIRNRTYDNRKTFSVYDIGIPVGCTVVLVGIFLAIQAKYLFGSHENIQLLDITYSEYVRKGFVELLTASTIGCLLAYITALKSRSAEGHRAQTTLKVINVVLIIELFGLLVSALQRDIIYIETYGLTRIRIVGGMFLIWLTGTLVLLLGMTIRKALREAHLFTGVFALSAAFVIAINVVNIDAIIAESPAPAGQKKDRFYTALLSPDAVSSWEENLQDARKTAEQLMRKRQLTDDEKQTLADAKLRLILLNAQIQEIIELYGTKEEVYAYLDSHDKEYIDTNDALPERILDKRVWQNENLSQKCAYTTISENPAVFIDMPTTIVQQIKQYQVDGDISLYSEEYDRLYEYDYPLTPRNISYWPQDVDSIEWEIENKG